MAGVYNNGLPYTIFFKEVGKGWVCFLKVHKVILSHRELYMNIIDIWGYDIFIMFWNMILMYDMA
jgi:hypothetical protein